MYKLLIMCWCKWCEGKSSNSWTFPAFLTLFNGALWSLRFTSLGERKLGPTMLNEAVSVKGLIVSVTSWNIIFSGPFSFTWFWIPREGAIQHFDKPLCILNWRQNKRSSTYFHIWNSLLVTALLRSCQQYNIVWLLFLPHHWAENDRCLLTNFCCQWLLP